MLVKVRSAALFGIDVYLVHVQVDLPSHGNMPAEARGAQ